MKKINIYIVLILGFVLLWSCSKDEDKESKLESLKPFSEIIFNSPFDIYLIEDSCYKIEIIAYDKTIENIDYEVKDSVLNISNNKAFKWLNPSKNKILIYIHSKPLSLITLNETSHLHTLSPITSEHFGLILRSKTNEATLDLNCGSFYYWNDFPCGGKLTLKGQTNSIKLWNYAILSVDAKSLKTKEALVENNSQGNCTINVSNKLTYSISNSGNIILYGNPNEIVKKECSSTGKLIVK